MHILQNKAITVYLLTFFVAIASFLFCSSMWPQDQPILSLIKKQDLPRLETGVEIGFRLDKREANHVALEWIEKNRLGQR